MEGKTKAHKTSLIGFFLGMFAVVAGAFGVTTWFLTEASSTTTLTLMILIASFGIITCGLHIWNRTSSNHNTD